MKQTITVYVYMEQAWPGAEWKPAIWDFQMEEKDTRVFVNQTEVEIEIPDDFDPTPKQIAALERLRDEVRAEFTERLNEINTRISKLQALTYEVPA
jgi:hypothetical protein